MTQTTTPDGIVKWTNGDPASLVGESQAQGDSIQLALSKRERYDFTWANSGERTAETGMLQGSRGYQIDTKTEYIYDNSNWRLNSSYYEGTANTGAVGTSASAGCGVITTNATNSTDTGFVTPGTSFITIANPGVYSIQFTGKEAGSNVCSGQTQLIIMNSATFANVADRLSNSMFSGALMSTCVLPFYRTTVSNQQVWFHFYNDSGVARTMLCTLAIGRVG